MDHEINVGKNVNNKENTKYRKNYKIIAIILAMIIIIILLLGIFTTLYLSRRETSLVGKATGPVIEQKIEISNSYLFASPLKAKAGSGEKIRVTVFILDGQGRGVYGKKVKLGIDERIYIEEVQAITDDLGKTVFDISSYVPGLYFIEATVEEKLIPQRVNVSFE